MPYKIQELAGQLYRPSNGAEGEYFRIEFCYRCKRDQNNDCDILGRTFWLDITDPEYPKEWVHDAEGQPVCTAFDPI